MKINIARQLHRAKKLLLTAGCCASVLVTSLPANAQSYRGGYYGGLQGYASPNEAFEFCRTQNIPTDQLESCITGLLQKKGTGVLAKSAYENPQQVRDIISSLSYSGGFYGGSNGYATQTEAINQCRVQRVPDHLLFDCVCGALKTKGLGHESSPVAFSLAEIRSLISSTSIDGCYKSTATTIVCPDGFYVKSNKATGEKSSLDPSVSGRPLKEIKSTLDSMKNSKSDSSSEHAK